ncbi:MAG: response regulator [Planctomycetes bacterium]|nr:response regulator [Planctomycetota bacterium]MCB9891909.1 response regulator [Planctomycetota bacterium]
MGPHPPQRAIPGRVLIVDDDRDQAASLGEVLEAQGYEYTTSQDAQGALEASVLFAPQVALVDFRLGQENGLRLVERLRSQRPDLLCVLMTAYAEAESAIEAVRSGVYDYLRKPLNPAALLATLERGLEHIHLTEQLRRSQRMDAVGQLAGGVAHDFNNVLTTILGNLDLLRGNVDAQAIDEIEAAVRRASALTKKLLAFGRRQEIRCQTLDLSRMVHESRDMLLSAVREDIQLSFELESDPWSVLADRNMLEQILLNLVLNARDALSDGGRVTIQVLNRNVTEEFASRNVGAHAGPHVCLIVEDDGVGMDEHTLARAFEPFFTTKGPNEGTGLGLTTVHGLVQQLHGHVSIESRTGAGTRVSILLPVSTNSREEERPIELVPANLRGENELVLVCEDDASVRQVLCRVLARQNYRVLEARRPGEALRIAREHPGDIDLLITDIVLPEMKGDQLLEAVTESQPRVQAIFMSGYASALSRRQLSAHVLLKPFAPRALLERVRVALEVPPPEHAHR